MTHFLSGYPRGNRHTCQTCHVWPWSRSSSLLQRKQKWNRHIKHCIYIYTYIYMHIYAYSQQVLKEVATIWIYLFDMLFSFALHITKRHSSHKKLPWPVGSSTVCAVAEPGNSALHSMPGRRWTLIKWWTKNMEKRDFEHQSTVIPWWFSWEIISLEVVCPQFWGVDSWQKDCFFHSKQGGLGFRLADKYLLLSRLAPNGLPFVGLPRLLMVQKSCHHRGKY